MESRPEQRPLDQEQPLVESPNPDSSSLPSETLSKNARKKLLRKQKRLESRVQWKAALAERRKGKRHSKIQKCKDEGLPLPRSKWQKCNPDGQQPKSRSIVIDMAYSSLMTDQERKSLATQLTRCYALNRRTVAPVHLIFTGLDPLQRDLLGSIQPGCDNWDVVRHEQPVETSMAEQFGSLVYLSADADEVIKEWNPSDILVIGGLVDRNRHKGVAKLRASQLGIRTMRLPLTEHIRLTSSQVLTTVNGRRARVSSLLYFVVFEILIRYAETKSWKLAIEASIPQRKRAASQGHV